MIVRKPLLAGRCQRFCMIIGRCRNLYVPGRASPPSSRAAAQPRDLRAAAEPTRGRLRRARRRRRTRCDIRSSWPSRTRGERGEDRKAEGGSDLGGGAENADTTPRSAGSAASVPACVEATSNAQPAPMTANPVSSRPIRSPASGRVANSSAPAATAANPVRIAHCAPSCRSHPRSGKRTADHGDIERRNSRDARATNSRALAVRTTSRDTSRCGRGGQEKRGTFAPTTGRYLSNRGGMSGCGCCRRCRRRRRNIAIAPNSGVSRPAAAIRARRRWSGRTPAARARR